MAIDTVYSSKVQPDPMAPFLPRMHLFEIDDQPWFPPFLRAKVQAALTCAWVVRTPLQALSPAQHVACILTEQLGPARLRTLAFVDFCAGAGGPTPTIERALNRQLALADASADYPPAGTTRSAETSAASSDAPPYAAVAAPGNGRRTHANGRAAGNGNGNGASKARTASANGPVPFLLTDLHPHPTEWARAAARSDQLDYVAAPVDASAVPPDVLARYAAQGRGLFRLFNLAFHHFDDGLARAILKDTVENSEGFGIFELQHRHPASFPMTVLFGLGTLLAAPYYAWQWGSAAALFFAWLVPVLPFVLVFDGFVSGLRTRTPAEVEALLRTCGARGGTAAWEVRSGAVRHLWPCGYVWWVIGVKKKGEREEEGAANAE